MSAPQPIGFAEFERRAQAAISPPFVSKLNAVWFHEITRNKPKRNWLIKGLLLAGTFGIIYGPPGSGKSFITSDLCLSMAASAALGDDQPEWFGYKGRCFGVVYVVAEGRDDFEIRMHAWRAQRGVPDNAIVPFVFLATSLDLRSSDVDAKKLVEEIKGLSTRMRADCGVEVGLVVLDTVARTLAGGNENASEVMSGFVANCGRVQAEIGCAVLGVHHGGKEAGRGPRGHEALHGAADFEIEVEPPDEGRPNRWVVRKLKAGPGGAAHQFRLKQVSVGEDDDGDEITSCVVVSRNNDAPNTHLEDKGLSVSSSDMEFLKALKEAIERRGIMPPRDLSLDKIVTLVVKADDVKRVFWARQATSEDGEEEEIKTRLRQRWSRAHRKMLDRGVIGVSDPWIWMTGKQVRGLALRGVDGTRAEVPDEAPVDSLIPQDLRDDDFLEM